MTTPSPARSVPWWWPARVYYGWAIVGALGLTSIGSYGILLYGFSAFIDPMEAELGWTKAQITGAMSVGLLVAGAVAIPVGHWVDAKGARGIVTLASAIVPPLLVTWSQVTSLSSFYVTWVAIGAVMAAVFYEPAFAVVATWFRSKRDSALTLLTFLGGFSGVAVVPLAVWLVQRFGWRMALIWLAALYALVAVPAHAIVLRRRPADIGLEPDGEPQRGEDHGSAAEQLPSVSLRQALTTASFQRVTSAFMMSALVTTAMIVHLIPYLVARGHTPERAGAALATVGLMALPGRLIFTPIGAQWGRSRVTAVILGSSAIGCAVLVSNASEIGVWLFAAVFGVGLGAIAPARASLIADIYGARHFGRISGAIAFGVSLARAAAPVGASALFGLGQAFVGPGRAYELVIWTLVVLGILSSGLVFSLPTANRGGG